MRRSTKLLPLLLALPVSACLVAAASLTAVVASQEFIDHATVAYLKIDHETVWLQTKETLGRLSLDPIEVEESVGAARRRREEVGLRVLRGRQRRHQPDQVRPRTVAAPGAARVRR